MLSLNTRLKRWNIFTVGTSDYWEFGDGKIELNVVPLEINNTFGVLSTFLLRTQHDDLKFVVCENIKFLCSIILSPLYHFYITLKFFCLWRFKEICLTNHSSLWSRLNKENWLGVARVLVVSKKVVYLFPNNEHII